ncbi:hypothetical protein SEUCBS140593_003389 [Sporothrix eucalyptigena]|uniref:Terpenoid synthase n=1 Tax=Sporothrix eucalyptigena TaxID=1812306 RepID=A0ABP0BER1_9PEZI
MGPLSPLDCFIDPQYGFITKCAFHNHIRECFLLEMHRTVAKDQLRFQHSMQMLHEAVLCPPLLMRTEYAAEVPPELHDPRFRLIVEHYTAVRKTIPMAFDEAGLPVLRPLTDQYVALDGMEGLRLAMNERDRLHMISERSRRRAFNAHILITSTLSYVRALRNLFDMTEGSQRAVFDCGVMSAMETERQVTLLATDIIEDYFEDKEIANDILYIVTKRMANYVDVLNANKNCLNCDVLTSVAIAANLHFFRKSLISAGYQAARPLEGFSVPREPDATAEQRATWTYASVKTEAIRKYIVAERALETFKSDMAAMGKTVDLEFHMYPQRNHSTGVVTFYIDQCAYVDIQEDLASEL